MVLLECPAPLEYGSRSSTGDEDKARQWLTSRMPCMDQSIGIGAGVWRLGGGDGDGGYDDGR
jgi:hypothetical protein